MSKEKRQIARLEECINYMQLQKSTKKGFKTKWEDLREIFRTYWLNSDCDYFTKRYRFDYRRK